MKRLFLYLIATFVIIISITTPVPAQMQRPGLTFGAPVTEALIRYQTQTGLSLYSYFKAYTVANDTLKSYLGEGDIPTAMGSILRGNKWTFAWGYFEEPYTFIVEYAITVDENGTVEKINTVAVRNEYTQYVFTARARAFAIAKYEVSKKVLNMENVPYRVAILPFSDDELQAHIAPEQTDSDSTLFGGDILYIINRTGSNIRSMIQYHQTIMKVPLVLPDDTESVMYIPNSPMFSPMDVANALERKTTLTVITMGGNFRIFPDGRVENQTPTAY